MTENDEGPVTHPSGWWRAADCKWYRPDQQPAERDDESSTDLGIGVSLVAVTVLLATVVPWTAGNANVTLLVAGTAGAFVTRWWAFGRAIVS